MTTATKLLRHTTKILSTRSPHHILPRHYSNAMRPATGDLTAEQLQLLSQYYNNIQQKAQNDTTTTDNKSNDSTTTTDHTSTVNTGLLRGASPTTDTNSNTTDTTTLSYSLKPSEMVKQLDKYIIGQADAKRAVAVACRQRWRRHQLNDSLKRDVTPKNILLIGPTGCGKTEIARRLAKLTNAPFLKVEATKYTEVGFYGKDVDSMISDLLHVGIQLQKHKYKQQSQAKVVQGVENRIIETLIGQTEDARTIDSIRNLLRSGALDAQVITVDMPNKESSSSGTTVQQALNYTMSLASRAGSRNNDKRTCTVKEARTLLEDAELDQMISNEDMIQSAIESVENDGIIFIDEIDKVAKGRDTVHRGADASADGVQRDLLPLIEGTTVSTKLGDIKTDHILFIASGSFYAVKPTDLLAELQGRLPIRVELQGLTEDDFYKILTHTEQSLIKQQTLLLRVDGITLTFTDAAIREIARVAYEVNRTVENIGARRLSTVVERIVGEISYTAPDMPEGTEIVIDVQQVQEKVQDLMKSADLQKYIL